MFGQAPRGINLQAYGVVVWEMLSGGALPWGDCKVAAIAFAVAREQRHLAIPDTAPPMLQTLLKGKWGD